MSEVEHLVGQNTTDKVHRTKYIGQSTSCHGDWEMCEIGHACVASHRNIVQVGVVTMLLSTVLIMTLEDVIPTVSAVTAWWKIRS